MALIEPVQFATTIGVAGFLAAALLSADLGHLQGESARRGAERHRVAITGIVWDSIAGRALANASVQLVAVDPSVATQSTASDSLGRFRFSSVAQGTYVLGFFHPALDTLGIELRGRDLTVGTIDQEIIIAGPSTRTVMSGLCGDTLPSNRTTLVFGQLRDADNDSPIENGGVVASWSEPQVIGGVVSIHDRTATVAPRRSGWFAICGLPPATSLEIRGGRDMDSTGVLPIRLLANDLRYLRLSVGKNGLSNARLTGRITGASGVAIAGAQVWISGTAQRALSDAGGSYVLDALPVGTHVLEVRAIGYTPQTIAIVLNPATTTLRDIVLPQAVVLPTVTTLGTKSSKNLAAFEAHQRSSAGGFFVRPTRLDDYPPMQQLHSLVQGLPNVAVRYQQGEWGVVMYRPGTHVSEGPRAPCIPQMFLNGTKTYLTFGDLDSTIDPNDLLGVEVYVRQQQIPSIYSLPPSQPCGLIAVWTRSADELTQRRSPED